ncbi:MAG: ribosome biogenesis GTP-binding protein YsxC, partial [Methanosarcinales archaeon]
VAGSKYLGDNSTLLAPGVEPPTWTEMAVIGRSNVGKSSLLNALLGSKDNKFVSVSRHPGSTTHLDFYAVGLSNPPQLVIVDTPGYGYNKRGKDAQGEWFRLIRHYLKNRNPTILPRTLLLIDARQGLQALDVEVMNMLEGVYAPYHVVLTKADLVSEAALESLVMQIAARLSKFQLPFPLLNAVSSKSGEGISQLHECIMLSLKLYRKSV